MTEDRKHSRLPPPAFPPGSRRTDGAALAGKARPAYSVTGDEAFYYPDRQASDDAGPSFTEQRLGEGTATGIGDDAHVTPEELAAKGDPHVTELATAVAKLAEGLRRRGEAGLHATAEMSRFEATLRAYCVGYLAGRRAEHQAS